MLSPSPRLFYIPDDFLGRVPRYTFEPLTGWSWREVLVWSTDAVRASHEAAAAQESSAFKAEALANLDRYAAAPSAE